MHICAVRARVLRCARGILPREHIERARWPRPAVCKECSPPLPAHSVGLRKEGRTTNIGGRASAHGSEVSSAVSSASCPRVPKERRPARPSKERIPAADRRCGWACSGSPRCARAPSTRAWPTMCASPGPANRGHKTNLNHSINSSVPGCAGPGARVPASTRPCEPGT